MGINRFKMGYINDEMPPIYTIISSTLTKEPIVILFSKFEINWPDINIVLSLFIVEITTLSPCKSLFFMFIYLLITSL